MYSCNADTVLRGTLSMAPSVSVLMAFDCTTFVGQDRWLNVSTLRMLLQK